MSLRLADLVGEAAERAQYRPACCPQAFAFLNALQVFKLAVSLGGTESLASHPAAMTHSGVPADVRALIGVLETTIRLSVGIEHPDDLLADLAQALAA